ncbi:MAG: hypothetical protein J0L69_02435 [Bacteroidetes bacterium]|nr:hypothetical protein [Bacteroidota bacterium]
MDHIVAYGFTLGENKKVITKFTYGVALLQSPFYVIGLGICKMFSIPNTGYSPVNHLIVDIAGIFYACLGLLLLVKLLMHFYPINVSIICGLIVFTGTNTFYYASIQPGMSHAYSFFLITASLYAIYMYSIMNQVKYYLALSFCFLLIVLIRPINIIYILPIIAFNVSGLRELKNRIKLLFTVNNIVATSLIATIIFTPQLLYWKFAYGKFIADSYKEETFSFLTDPKITEFLFSPHNGLLTYSPLYLILLSITLLLFTRKKLMYASILLVVINITYLSASWHVFFFGCGFGARNFVELSCLLSFPLAEFFLTNKSRLAKPFLIGLIIVSVFCNLKLMYAWDTCFWGKDDWDWREYRYLLHQKSLTINHNLDEVDPNKIELIEGKKAYKIDSLELYSAGIFFIPNKLTKGYFKSATISVELKPLSETFGAQLVCMGDLNDSTVFYNSTTFTLTKNKWQKIELKSKLHYNNRADYRIKAFILNDKKEEYLFRNLKVELE